MNITRQVKNTALSSLGAVSEVAQSAEVAGRVVRKSLEDYESNLDFEREIKKQIRVDFKDQLATSLKPTMAREIFESLDIAPSEIEAMVASLTVTNKEESKEDA